MESIPSTNPVKEVLVAYEVNVFRPQGVNDVVVELDQVVQDGVASFGLSDEFIEISTAF